MSESFDYISDCTAMSRQREKGRERDMIVESRTLVYETIGSTRENGCLRMDEYMLKSWELCI